MRRFAPFMSIVAAAALALTACSGTSNSAKDDNAGNKKELRVVASTNIWGAVAKEVAGNDAQVTSIINSPNQDPHGYQATAQDKLLFNQATVVIVNGGGYDDWAIQLAKSAQSKPLIINAVELSGLKTKANQEDFNEHVFYSLETAQKVADQLTRDLQKNSPKKTEAFAANATKFKDGINDLNKRAEAFKKQHSGLSAVATEPVAGYLMESLGIKNLTPEEFVEQSETESGPSAAVVNETLTLIKDKKVNMLVLNAQTEDAVSNQLSGAAHNAGIPIVQVYETMPQNMNSYTEFIGNAISAFEQAAAK